MPKLCGNKGEWSEIYVFLKLMAVGQLYAANAACEKIDSVYYKILKIFRNENFGLLEFCIDTKASKIDVYRGKFQQEKIVSIQMKDFQKWADILLRKIQMNSSSSFEVPDVQNFLQNFHVETIKAKNTDKADIQVQIHDINTCFDAIQGFSIKSRLGSPSTLINASKATNFIFRIVGNLSDKEISEFNKKQHFIDKFSMLQNTKCSIHYHSMQNQTFQCNLLLIDSYLPQICANLLLQYYSGGKSLELKDALQRLEKINPLNYNQQSGHHYYEYKIKKLLSECALGMLPSKAWNGTADATGGYIIVKEDGDIVCYHLFNYNDFEMYLLNNTKFETPSTSRHDFGKIYKDDEGNLFLKLNLQIRFIK